MDLFDGLPIPKASEGEKNAADADSEGASVNITDCDAVEEPRIATKRKLDALEENDACGTLKTSTKNTIGRLKLKGYSAETQGERETMEDRFCLLDEIFDSRLTKHPNISEGSFFGVFDGHGGRKAANFVADGFLESFLSTFTTRGGATAGDLDAAICSSLIATYRNMDAAFLTECIKQKPARKDGTTATTALILNTNKLFVANVGDSQAVLCRYDPVQKLHKPVILTTEHSPALYEERLRIQQQGGTVKNNRLSGILEVSRSIGDLPYKKGTGLISTPSVRKCILTADDRFIVIACDGIWKALTPSEVIDLVLQQVKDAKSEDVDLKYSTACVGLAKEAVKRLTGDNVTVLLVRITSIEDSFNNQSDTLKQPLDGALIV